MKIEKSQKNWFPMFLPPLGQQCWKTVESNARVQFWITGMVYHMW